MGIAVALFRNTMPSMPKRPVNSMPDMVPERLVVLVVPVEIAAAPSDVVDVSG